MIRYVRLRPSSAKSSASAPVGAPILAQRPSAQDSASPPPRPHFYRGIIKKHSTSVSIVAGIGVFLADAFVAPNYGLGAFYVVLLIASVTRRPRRRLIWTTGMYIALSILGFGIGHGHASTADGSVRLFVDLATLALTAGLIMRLNLSAGIVTRSWQKSEFDPPQQDPERMAALFMEKDRTEAMADQMVEHLTAILLSSVACKRWLDRATPNVEEARTAIGGSIEAARRASNIVQHVRSPSMSCAVGP